jgi:hypothetical protein
VVFESWRIYMSQENVCRKICETFGKPDNYLSCKAINVYDDKYRVNMYVKTNVEGIEGKKIGKSYFIKYDDKTNSVVLL